MTGEALPEPFAVGGVVLPPGVPLDDAANAAKFSLEAVLKDEKDNGAMVMVHLAGEKKVCVGTIAAWGSVTLENACERGGFAAGS